MNHLTAKASQLIACQPQDAFDAFVDPQKITQFWLESASAPLAAGARVTWQFMVPGARDDLVVEALDAPNHICFSWSDGTKVSLRFAAHPAGGTEVSVEATGFAGPGAVDEALNTTEGFSIVLCDLKTYLESGRSANLVRAKAELIAAATRAAK